MSSGSSSLHLPQKQPLNLHFSHTILPLTVPLNRRSRNSRHKTSTTQPEKASASVYVSSLPFSQLSGSFLSYTWKVEGGARELMGGLPLLARPFSSMIGRVL